MNLLFQLVNLHQLKQSVNFSKKERIGISPIPLSRQCTAILIARWRSCMALNWTNSEGSTDSFSLQVCNAWVPVMHFTRSSDVLT